MAFIKSFKNHEQIDRLHKINAEEDDGGVSKLTLIMKFSRTHNGVGHKVSELCMRLEIMKMAGIEFEIKEELAFHARHDRTFLTFL